MRSLNIQGMNDADEVAFWVFCQVHATRSFSSSQGVTGLGLQCLHFRGGNHIEQISCLLENRDSKMTNDF